MGRGLDLLIPKDEGMPKKSIEKNKENKEPKENQVLTLSIHDVEPNRNQPRKQFDEDAIEELADSIKQYGVIQPLIVQKKDKYNITWSERLLITTASALHDIGKIGIDDKILNKPGKLTDEEFKIMQNHTIIGARILKNMEGYEDEELMMVAYQICRWHHERYDGRGYPDGLKGDEIPISAQVVSLADVYDALVGERVYKKAYSHEKAIQMILNLSLIHI